MKIFRPVHCKAYLKKESDGTRIILEEQTKHKFAGEEYISTKPYEKSAWREDKDIKATAVQDYYENGEWKTRDLKDLSECCGEYVEKVYRRRVEEEFDGFLVGITYIKVNGRIGTDYDETHIDCYDDYVWHLFKDYTPTKVGVVYFKNNAKRYVLLDDISE